jgi:hypothetical protein
MKDLVDYLNAFYKDESSNGERQQINNILETLFFDYISNTFRCLESSDEYKFGLDLREIQKILNGPSPTLRKFHIKSSLLKEKKSLISKYFNKEVLEEFDINYLRRELLAKYRPYQRAAFLAYIIVQDKRKEGAKWVLSGLAGFCGGLIISNLEFLIRLFTGIIKK